MKVTIIFALFVVGIQAATAQVSNATCAQQFDAYRVCARSQIAKDKNDPAASESRREQIRNDFSTCATQNACQDPYPSESERSAREACFSEARSNMRQQLQSCVQTQFRDFQLPGDDTGKDSYWNFLLMRTFTAMRSLGDNRYNRNRANRVNWQKADGNRPPNDICGFDDNKKNKTLECLKIRGTFNKTSAKSNWRRNTCRIKNQCDQVSPSCIEQWTNQSKPKLCDCVDGLKRSGLGKMQDQYLQCLRNRGVRNVDERDDGRVVIAKNLNNWCPGGQKPQAPRNQTDPCKIRRGIRNGTVNGTSGGNSSSSSSGSVTGSGSGSSSGSSSNASSNATSPYDDGTPAHAPDVHPFSGMMNDNVDMFAPVNQTAAKTTSTLTSGLSSLGGGALGGPLNGGGSNLGGNSAFSSLLSGAASSLFGSGTILGSLTSLVSDVGNLGGSGLFASFLGGSSAFDLLTGSGLFGSLFNTTSIASSPGALTDSMPSMFGGVGDLGNLLPA